MNTVGPCNENLPNAFLCRWLFVLSLEKERTGDRVGDLNEQYQKARDEHEKACQEFVALRGLFETNGWDLEAAKDKGHYLYQKMVLFPDVAEKKPGY